MNIYYNKSLIQFLKQYGLLAFIMLVLDSIYLKAVTPHFSQLIKTVQGTPLQLKLIPAALCYVFLVFSLYYFVINQNGNQRENVSIFTQTKNAFLLGLCIYMVYELTNMAIIKKWNYTTVLLDGVWGGILFALTTFVYMKTHKWI